jgi:hypothetical protein
VSVALSGSLAGIKIFDAVCPRWQYLDGGRNGEDMLKNAEKCILKNSGFLR